MEDLAPNLKTALADLLLSLADDKFILGHRNADWTGLGPILEEDIAFSSLAQDDLAHALALYQFVAQLTGDQADRLAYGRQPHEYRCAALVELEDEFDWAVAIVRHFLCDHFEQARLGRLARCAHRPLRELAGRMLAEERLSLGHADQWIVRLGRSGGDARSRVQAALVRLAPLGCELLEPTRGIAELEASGLYPATGDLFAEWSGAVTNVLEAAGLTADLRRLPAGFAAGRQGKRSPAFAALHDELTEVYRVEPQARW